MTLRILSLALLACAVLAAGGCGNLNRVPRYVPDAKLMPGQFKRYAKYDEQDFLLRFRAEAYYPRTGDMEEPLSQEQRDVLARHGTPDYIRHRFKSETNELVDQWAWWDRATTTQFVQGQLVFEGELTPMDQYMIRFGYPQRASYVAPVTGVRRDFWIYTGILQTPRKQVTFTNEQLISEYRF